NQALRANCARADSLHPACEVAPDRRRDPPLRSPRRGAGQLNTRPAAQPVRLRAPPTSRPRSLARPAGQFYSAGGRSLPHLMRSLALRLVGSEKMSNALLSCGRPLPRGQLRRKREPNIFANQVQVPLIRETEIRKPLAHLLDQDFGCR